MDDADARREAHRLGLRVIGTLRVLSTAARAGLVDLEEALAQLQRTSFRADATVLRTIRAHLRDEP